MLRESVVPGAPLDGHIGVTGRPGAAGRRYGRGAAHVVERSGLRPRCSAILGVERSGNFSCPGVGVGGNPDQVVGARRYVLLARGAPRNGDAAAQQDAGMGSSRDGGKDLPGCAAVGAVSAEITSQGEHIVRGNVEGRKHIILGLVGSIITIRCASQTAVANP